jgi:proteasome accessory factor C
MSAKAAKRGPRSTKDRIKGLLVMLPWLMEREEVAIADMARQFSISEKDLVDDLLLAAMCGVPPYSPFELTEIYIDDENGMIEVGVNRRFQQRLSITAAEALALDAMAEVAEKLPGLGMRRNLKSARKKLQKVLGDDNIEIQVETPEFLETMMDALQSGEQLVITHTKPSDGSTSERTITVRTVFADKGHWYVRADDSKSGGLRHFRIDRIEKVEHTGHFADVKPLPAEKPNWFADSDSVPTVRCTVQPSAQWLLEQYSYTNVSEAADGSRVVNIKATSEHWLGRLLLRAEGGIAVQSPSDHADVLARTAAAVLSRYS